MQLKNISVVMLGVSALAPAVEFYRDKLGLKVQSQFEGFAFLETGGSTLVLSEALARHAKQIPGAVEVVFAVDDVTEAHQELRRRGVTFTQQPRNVTGASWAANFNDPDGHQLSVFGPQTKQS